MPSSSDPNPRLSWFLAGTTGPWRIEDTRAIRGEPVEAAARMRVVSGQIELPVQDAAWALRGVTSNDRYVVRVEKSQLLASQEGLGRPESKCAALIPVRKNAAWWALSQDERRKVIEEQSHHIAIGMTYLPAIARRLHHCRDLESSEPFDFLTWFEFAKTDRSAFDELLAALRATAEWKYVDREVDIRLTREDG